MRWFSRDASSNEKRRLLSELQNASSSIPLRKHKYLQLFPAKWKVSKKKCARLVQRQKKDCFQIKLGKLGEKKTKLASFGEI